MPYTDDPTNVPADAVRFMIGDKSLTNPDLSDAEIAFLLDEQNGNTLRAAARAAEVLVAKYTTAYDQKRVGPLVLRSFSSTAESFRKLALVLWKRANTSSGGPWAGGISRADKSARQQDQDRVRPAFRRRLMEYPNVSLTGGDLQQEDLLSPPPEILP